jgi:uncharacterized protein YjaG (DUF416 family)
MNYRDFIELLKQQTSTQKHESEKLYVDYKRFSEIENWGNADLLMDAINVCQQALQNSIDNSKIKELLPQIDSITPHMDDFGSELGSYALNASAAVYETLQFILDNDNTHVYNIATYYTDSIDFKIQEEKELTEVEIEKHPLMVDAWNFVIEETKRGT